MVAGVVQPLDEDGRDLEEDLGTDLWPQDLEEAGVGLAHKHPGLLGVILQKYLGSIHIGFRKNDQSSQKTHQIILN